VFEHALTYARLHWRVMPLHNIENGICTCKVTPARPKAGAECPSPGKHPRIKTGRAFEAATTDEVQIRKWWAKWPRANIGIATGQQSRLCVVDIDSAEGAATLMRLCKEAGDASGALPTTLTARSGRQGAGGHLYFYCDQPSPSNSGHGLDIRGDGGNLVAPPSNHVSGQPYAWLNPGQPIAPMPAWLLHWFRNRDREARGAREPVGAQNIPAHLRGRAGAALTARVALQEAVDLVDIDSALEAIPNTDMSWDEWNRVGMAVWRACEGSPEGEEAFDYWSQKSRKYDPDAAAERWRAYAGSPPDSIGFGSLYYAAKQADPSWSPPTQRKSEVIPPEMRAFSMGQANGHSLNDRPPETNGHHLNGHSANHWSVGPAPQVFALKPSDNPLIELNEKFSVIGDIGGKCRVLGWTPSKVDPHIKVPSFQDFKSFGERHGARYIAVKTEKPNGDIIEENKQLGAYWLKWTGRKHYEGIDLDPSGEPVLEGNILNLWSGFAVQPAPGTWQRMQDHITDVLADGDADSAAYILKFAAWCVQNPGRPAEAAMVFQGDKGTGKGTFARAIRDIFGQHGMQIFSAKHLTGQFNAHLRNCLLLFSDEAFWAGDKQGESTLKGLITEPTLVIEQKGVDASQWKNRLKVIMAANAEWVVPAGPMERRYAVFKVSPKQIGNGGYFDKLNAELKAGGLEAMLAALLALDLGRWHPRQIVKTAGLREQKARSLGALQEWFEGVLQEGQIPGAGTDPTKVPASALIRIMREDNRRLMDVSSTALGRFLADHGCRKVHEVHGNAWQFPALGEMRAAWERAFGGAWKWSEDVREWRGR